MLARDADVADPDSVCTASGLLTTISRRVGWRFDALGRSLRPQSPKTFLTVSNASSAVTSPTRREDGVVGREIPLVERDEVVPGDPVDGLWYRSAACMMVP
jgi:hypothetical protein